MEPKVLKTSELANEAEEWLGSLELFAKAFFPEQFDKPFTSLHRRILKPLDDNSLAKVALDAFRGCGKTSIVSLAYAARGILFRLCRFIVYITQTETNAIMQTDNLKRELLTNPDIRRVFGSIKTKYQSGLDESFGKKCWVAQLPDDRERKFKTFVLPRGSGQQVRGLLFEGHRPDLILIDDLEDKKTIHNPEIRRTRKEWLYGDVLKCVGRQSKSHRFIYTDTVKHEDSLLLNIQGLSGWYSDSIPICNENIESLCPEFMSTEDLKTEHEEHIQLGLGHVFAQEYMNKIVAPEDKPFKRSTFKYYSEQDQEFRSKLDRLISIVLVDPARTRNPKSADSGFSVWGIDVSTGMLHYRLGIGEKFSPGEQHQLCADLVKKYNASVLGVETHGLHEHFTHPLETKLREEGLYIQLVDLKPRRMQGLEDGRGEEGVKAARVMAMLSYYRQGRVLHSREGSEKYEEQLLSLPYAPKWDVMESASYIVQILKEGHVMLSQEANKKSEEEAYRQLRREYASMRKIDWEATYII